MSTPEETNQSPIVERGRSSSSSSSSQTRPIVDKHRNLSSEELCVFIEALDSYSPTIPEAVIKHNLQKGISVHFHCLLLSWLYLTNCSCYGDIS